jgi:site-specific DNA-methyltransferase (adenine-specific)
MLLINGDCIKEMQKLIDDGVQVDSVVTDPPYELGFMGKSWDSTGIAFNPKTWELALKLLKPGGYLVGFSASRNYHRMAVAIEDAGFEIRDQIMWLYGSGFPKSQNIGKAIDKKLGNKRKDLGIVKGMGKQNPEWNGTAQGRSENYFKPEYNKTEGNTEWEGWGTALKPAHEPIVMARKPLSESSIVDNVLKHGTGAINIDGCRIEGDNNTERKTANRKSRSEDGVWTDNNSGMKQEDNHFADADPRGRFPANVMHDGSDVITKEFPQTGKSIGGKTKSAFGDIYGTYSGDVLSSSAGGFGDEGSAARFFYCPKTSKSERHNGDANTHPTVKPVDLMRYLCRLVTPKGGTVLDPFMGSGSTGMAAKDEGFDFIGIEKEKEYFEICESRINRFAPLMDFM